MHFISYSRRDAADFAIKLHNAVASSCSPVVELCMDKIHHRPGDTFDRWIEQTIPKCTSVIFALTKDSIDSPFCRMELHHAERYFRPLVPLRVHRDAGTPLLLEGLPKIDFTDQRPFNEAVQELCGQLAWLESPEGVLHMLHNWVQQLRRGQEGADGDKLAQIQQQIAWREEQFSRLRRGLRSSSTDPVRTDEPVGSRLEHEDAVDPPPPATRSRRFRLVNDLPEAVPEQLCDRDVELRLLEEQLTNEQVRIVVLHGRDGIGKTAMSCRLLQSLAIRDDPPLDGAVYLTAHGYRPLTAAILHDVGRLLPDDGAQLGSLLEDPELTLSQKLDAVLERLDGTRTVVVLDNLEELIDETTGKLRDAALADLLQDLAWERREQQVITVLIVTRAVPEIELDRLSRRQPGIVARLDLNQGLPLEDAKNLLRRLEAESTIPSGLEAVDESLLDRTHELTKGHPRALEAVYAILTTGNPDVTLGSLLNDIARLPADDDVVEFLVTRMFNQLDPVEQQVVEALAVYNRPVPAGAVDHLLRPYLGSYPSKPVLQRLVQYRLVRSEENRYYYLPLTPDRRVALTRIRRDQPAGSDIGRPPFTQLALLHRAVAYFEQRRTEPVTGIRDLSPQLAEIDLRIQAEQYREAFRLLSDIDRRYLSSWGYSHALTLYREELINRLPNSKVELANLNALGNTSLRQEDYLQAIEYYTQALKFARRLNETADVKSLYVNLGSAHYQSGQLHQALEEYKTAQDKARKLERRAEAQPLIGLGLCRAELGQFRLAYKAYDSALSIAMESENPGLEASVLFNTGCLHAQLGRMELAFADLWRGYDLAHGVNALLEAQCLDALAALLVDQGRVPYAVKLAQRTVAMGQRMGNQPLLREANATLALACLCMNALDDARAAANAACRYQTGPRRMHALALKGLIVLRQNDRSAAEDAFYEALGLANSLRDLEHRNFAAHDVAGLVLCGLVLCGERQLLDEAVGAYGAARQIAAEPGIILRTVRLLDELEKDRPPSVLDFARRAAFGQLPLDVLAERQAVG